MMEDQSSESTLNFFADGICNQCGSDKISETVSCMLCCKPFHMTNCGDEEDKFYLPTSSLSQFEKAINKVGKFSKRPGCFRFVCDPCMTDYEVKRACKTNDNIQILDSKVNNLARDMVEIKQLLSKQAVLDGNLTTQPGPAPMQNPLPTSGNVWTNNEQVNKIKSHLVINKDANFDLNDAANSCSAQVHGKYPDKDGNLVVVCESPESRDALKLHIMQKGIAADKISEPKPRYPTISIVGFSSEMDKEELRTSIMFKNSMLANICANKNAVFDIVGVKSLRNNSSVFQAFVRVSDDVRSVIKSYGDKLFFGWEKLAVYDQLYIRRCNKCQGYNHIAKHCRNNQCCGLCASSDHQSLECPHKDKSPTDKAAFFSCINCKTANKPDFAHPAYSSVCSMYRYEQALLKKSLANESKNC
jgi:hypothetical protein